MRPWLRALFACSLLMNLAVVVAFAQQRRATAAEPEAPLVAQLGLDEAQQRALAALRHSLLERARALRSRSLPMQGALLDELRRATPDPARVRSLLTDYGAARSELQIEIVLALVEYRERLGAPQRAAFDAALGQPQFLRRAAGFVATPETSP